MCIAITITLSTRQLQTDTTIVLVAVECRQKLVLAVVAFKVRKILSKQLFVVTSSFTVGFVCQLLEYKTYCIITEEPQEIAILVVFVQRKQQKMHQAETAKKTERPACLFLQPQMCPQVIGLSYCTSRKAFFWPSFLRGQEEEEAEKKHSNQNCPRGEQVQ